jgi:hypothetical protein
MNSARPVFQKQKTTARWLVRLLIIPAAYLTACNWLVGSPQPAERDFGTWREPLQNCRGKDPAKVVVECNPIGSRCECKDLLVSDGGQKHD